MNRLERARHICVLQSGTVEHVPTISVQARSGPGVRKSALALIAAQRIPDVWYGAACRLKLIAETCPRMPEDEYVHRRDEWRRIQRDRFKDDARATVELLGLAGDVALLPVDVAAVTKALRELQENWDIDGFREYPSFEALRGFAKSLAAAARKAAPDIDVLADDADGLVFPTTDNLPAQWKHLAEAVPPCPVVPGMDVGQDRGGSLMTLRTGFEIDELFRWPKGRTERLARKGRIPHVLLPNGDRRFDEQKVLAILTDVPAKSILNADATQAEGAGRG